VATSVEEIIKKANLASYYQGNDGKAKVSMQITDSQGRVRNREFVILRSDVQDGGDQKFYVYFHQPTDVRKMVFLVHKYTTRDDDRWLYLPALDLVKRIAAADKRTSFVGSDYLYEDVSGRNPKDDIHTLIQTTDTHYVLDNKPVNTGSVEFSNYKLWINRKTFLPEKAEYYKGDSKEPYRTVEAKKQSMIQGFPTTTESVVTNHETGSKTTLHFSDIQYNLNLNENIFTERYLRRPPKEAR
jgi:hypothetical protein